MRRLRRLFRSGSGRFAAAMFAAALAVSTPIALACDSGSLHPPAMMTHHASSHSQGSHRQAPGKQTGHSPDCTMMHTCLSPAAPAVTLAAASVPAHPERPAGFAGAPFTVDRAPEPPPPRA